MSFRDCIQTAIDTGRVTARKGAEALEAFDAEYERALVDHPEGVANGLAAKTAVEHITTLKAEKRWQRQHEMQRAHELHSRLIKSDDPAEELERIIIDLENSYDTVRSFSMAHIDLMLSKYKPKKGGWVVPTDNQDNVVRAAYGDRRNAEAGEMFDSLADMQETLRKWANMYGANIPQNKNRRLFQTHDGVKVRAVPEDVWVKEHLGALDWEIMRYAGKPIAEENREEILRRTYRGIISDGADRANTAQGNVPNLASRLNRDRFLYYKSADDYLAMQKKYGAGNLYEQTIGMVDAMAKDISLLRVFGPNADSMKEFAKRTAKERGAEIDRGLEPGKRGKLQEVTRQTQVFEDEYNIHSRHVPTADGNWPVQAFATVRTMAVNALLGGVFIPSVYGDLANAKVARRLFNLPENRVLRNYLANFNPTDANIREMARFGVVQENSISLAHSRVRYFGALDGPHWARRIGDITYRMGLAAMHTQVARNAEGKQLLGIWAEYAGKKFDELPWAAAFAERGITAKDWNMLRKQALYEKDGATFLRPIDLFQKDSDEAKVVAQKFSDFMQEYMRIAVPEPTLRSRRAAGEASDPNSAMGQIYRTMTSLLSFPIAIYFNMLKRIAYAPGIRNKAVLGAKYFAYMTAAGAAMTQTKALVAGQNPHDMSPENLDFWGRAVINGGSLGILGDLVFNNINMNNSPHGRDNPTTQYVRSAHKLTIDNLIDAWQGKELELPADMKEFIDANIPDLWYTKLLWDRAVDDELFQQTDPKGWRRYQQYLNEHEEGMWWEPGRGPRAPELETAIGG